MGKINNSVFIVAESNLKDVGRGIVRIDPVDMEIMGVSVGDVVQIEGERQTIAKIMPTFPQDRGKRIIQMDWTLRNNAKTSLNNNVNVIKIDFKLAEKIVIAPLSNVRIPLGDKDISYIGSILTGLAVIEGDFIRVNFMGNRNQDFLVNNTTPGGPVLISQKTRILLDKIQQNSTKRSKISYEDIGGLSRELKKIREMIELPLKCPRLFDRLGIDPPKGVLLYGPPGCGKTLIARAVASETAAYFVHVTGPEIMGKFYGESEARLRGFFEEARKNAPSILFIDEIDAIAPKREEMGGEKQVERRVVAQLLALMDGLESRGDVIVIGATNIPNALDPALRRPGRFDRELEIAIPDQRDRLEILSIHVRGMPLASDVDLERLSRVTHGFVGADMEALCREAAMSVLRRVVPDYTCRIEEVADIDILQMEVMMDDFLGALKEVEPSAIREVFVEVPDVSWEDVGGLREIKRQLSEAVAWPLKHGELLASVGLRPPKGILLSGSPGLGKTLVVKAMANESEINFISVKGSELLSKYVGESEKGVREVFRKARQASPCILFFDEFDSLVPLRHSFGDSQVIDRVISQFLSEMDGIEELKDVLVLAASNRQDLIDPAIIRPGRFDLILNFNLPDKDDRIEILKIHSKKMPLDGDVSLEEISMRTEDFSGAELKQLCQEAARLALREYMASNGENKIVILKNHFDLAINSVMERKR
ncbi:CDC48 family AAA ATPase [Aminithiophilus ramosus]|uniref:CDC48 family AAA ATPase n=1 Tax=Aminithiophilus ramosus TaxID=3029084 RepID=A0A9Q7EZK1_9BACT|nr:CDC48 family AAA ATPase [Aminithiophilus ramosus]QTX32277.1 CDC48 family AAA ATPase [Aminithiophilus ramosus]